jgi:hypothetical protein
VEATYLCAKILIFGSLFVWFFSLTPFYSIFPSFSPPLPSSPFIFLFFILTLWLFRLTTAACASANEAAMGAAHLGER